MSVPSHATCRGLGAVGPATAAAALLLAGCGADGSPGSAPGGATRPSAASASASSEASPSFSPPLPATPSPTVGPPSGAPGSGLPRAVDGADVAACADGSCEVRVRAGDEVRFEDRIGLDTFTVVSVGNGALWHRAGDGGSRLAGSVSAPGHVQLNQLTVEIIAVEGDRAVIRMSI